MTQYATLNNIEHKDLRIIQRRSDVFGDNIMSTKVYPIEFRQLLSHYPIVFYKDPESGGVAPVALFGFEQGENLFLDESGWSAEYLPLLMEREPFSIGRGQGRDDQESLVINIDLDHPRVNKEEGEAVFLPHGGNSDYIEDMASKLQAIHYGELEEKALSDALLSCDLLEPFFLDVEICEGETHRLSGFLTINEEKLASLESEKIARLHESGYLQAIYFSLASLSNFRELIALKQARLSS